MSTSGTKTFNLNANQIIERAFGVLGKTSEGRSVSAKMYEDGRVSLNLLIKTLGAQEHLWTRTEASVTLVTDQANYALGTLFSTKPMRVLSVRRKVTLGGNEAPLYEMSRQEYFDQPSKTASPSTPTSFYYDPQTTTGTLYLWPVASSVVSPLQTLQVSYLRRMDDMVGTTDDLDMPQEWLQTLVWNLANDLETQYPVNDARIAGKIEIRARELFKDLKGWDNEPASIFLQPDYQGWDYR